jgi:glycosyltransferase involved in cell wall biosynthesis
MLKDLLVNLQHRCANAVLLSTIAALNNVGSPEDLAGKLFVLPPGIDTDEFVQTADIVMEHPTILFLANVSPRKGIYSLLKAFGRLTARMPSVRLTIAGDGPDLSAVKELVEASSFQDRVAFIGRVEHADVPNLMRRCSIYCLPSHGEPFGMTAIEAMASGKPLVVTRAGGLAHIVSDEGGRLVEVGNSVALANALEELLARPELLREMGEHNRLEAERTYAWPVVAARLERIYHQVVDGHTAQNPDLVTDQDIRSYRRLLRNPSSVTELGNIQNANHGVHI